MLRPIKVLFCHTSPTYIANLSNLYNFPANISEELRRKLEQEAPLSFDFHGLTSYQEALLTLVKANFEGRPTAGYYPERPFDLLACEVAPPSSSLPSVQAWDLLNQSNKKLNLGVDALLEQRDSQGKLIKKVYRPALISIALVRPEHKTLALVEQLMDYRVFRVLPYHMSSAELEIELQRCYRSALGGLTQVRVATDFSKNPQGDILAIRQNLRWKATDDEEGQNIYNRRLIVEQLSSEELEKKGIDIEDYRGRLKELFPEDPKFRELSISLLRSRYSQS